MTAVLKNWVSIKKTRGDLLKPATARSTVEMILGILRQYDFDEFKDAYKSFLAHLVDYNDPHKVTENGFLDELIDLVYGIYTKMTGTPLTEEDFRATIVPSLDFFELLRRILLNHWLYLKIRNPDGSVPQTGTVILGDDWGVNVNQTTPVAFDFGTALPNEDEFILRGWTGSITPRNIVFNALDLGTGFENSVSLFHTSTAAPYETVTGGAFGYPVSLSGSSNDLQIKIVTNKLPAQTTTLFTIINVSNTLIITMDLTGAISVNLNNTPVFTNVNCNDGKMWLSISRQGEFYLTTSHNSTLTTQLVTQSLDAVGLFTTGIVGVALAGYFSSDFGLKELSVSKPKAEVNVEPAILPLIFYTPPAEIAPIQGETTDDMVTPVFFPQPGYKVYLTLAGTWTGAVQVQISHDGGASWRTMTSGGVPMGYYSGNCDEVLTMVTDPLTRFRMIISSLSGTLSYRLAQ